MQRTTARRGHRNDRVDIGNVIRDPAPELREDRAGLRRLRREGFITFVQNSPLPNMPAMPDASAQTLADIWAYLKTIPVDAPPVDDVPLLRDVLTRKNQAAAAK